jgi:hypothetical protein
VGLLFARARRLVPKIHNECKVKKQQTAKTDVMFLGTILEREVLSTNLPIRLVERGEMHSGQL